MLLNFILATFVTPTSTTMNTRLKQFLAAENITQAQFADTIKVVRASVSHVISGRNNPSYDFIKAVMANYPKLNIEWLIFGKGKMYKDSMTASQELIFPEHDDILESAPGELDIDLSMENKENIETSRELNTLIDNIQTPVTQRKVSKILVLFDDGTFQEL